MKWGRKAPPTRRIERKFGVETTIFVTSQPAEAPPQLPN
jgi:hypothetical protein